MHIGPGLDCTTELVDECRCKVFAVPRGQSPSPN